MSGLAREPALRNVRIVLVRPIRSGNVGAVSRAMANFGLGELVLVAPACDPLDAQGLGFAARARPVLEAARIVPRIDDALDGCVATLATSAKGGLYRRGAGVTPAEGCRLALQRAPVGPVAIVFGPEDRGLVLEELLLFDRVIEIPASPAYPALNLASAAAVLCHELWQAHLAQGAARPEKQPLATDERKRAMYAILFEGLRRIGFFRGQQYEDHLKFALRHMLGRCDLTVNEVDILTGAGRQMQWYADHHPGEPPGGATRPSEVRE